MLANGRGRLVHDDDFTVVAEGLGNFHQLRLRQAESVHGRTGIDVEVQALQQGLGLFFQCAEVNHHARMARLPSQVDVFRHRHAGNRRQLLRDDGDARVQRFGRTVEMHFLAAYLDAAAVARQNAHQDVQEGRLAGAVAAAQRVHRAGLQIEAAVAQRRHAVKALGQALRVQQRGGRRTVHGAVFTQACCRPYDLRRRQWRPPWRWSVRRQSSTAGTCRRWPWPAPDRRRGRPA